VQHLAVGEDQRQARDAQGIGFQRVEVDLELAHAPAIRVKGAGGVVQARLVVAVLLLEMLGPQEQALAPQHLRWWFHGCLLRSVTNL
jgi:hypothetical protein